jgi:hypothetical protein
MANTSPGINPFSRINAYPQDKPGLHPADEAKRALLASLAKLQPEYDLKNRNELSKQRLVGGQKRGQQQDKFYNDNLYHAGDPKAPAGIEAMRVAKLVEQRLKGAGLGADLGYGLPTPPGTSLLELGNSNRAPVGTVTPPKAIVAAAGAPTSTTTTRENPKLRDQRPVAEGGDGPGGQYLPEKTVVKESGKPDLSRNFKKITNDLPGTPKAQRPITSSESKTVAKVQGRDKPKVDPALDEYEVGVPVERYLRGKKVWVVRTPEGKIKKVDKPK